MVVYVISVAVALRVGSRPRKLPDLRSPRCEAKILLLSPPDIRARAVTPAADGYFRKVRFSPVSIFVADCKITTNTRSAHFARSRQYLMCQTARTRFPAQLQPESGSTVKHYARDGSGCVLNLSGQMPLSAVSRLIGHFSLYLAL